MTSPAPVVFGSAAVAIDDVVALAFRRRAARLSEEPAVNARWQKGAAIIEERVRTNAPTYGVNTGFGRFVDVAISAEDVGRLQLNLLRSHAAGGGAPLPPEVVRAAMAVRLNQLGAGGRGASDRLLDALAAELAAGVVPVVREVGALGTGDLPSLADIGLALMGEGEAWSRGAIVPARRALRRAQKSGDETRSQAAAEALEELSLEDGLV